MAKPMSFLSYIKNALPGTVVIHLVPASSLWKQRHEDLWEFGARLVYKAGSRPVKSKIYIVKPCLKQTSKSKLKTSKHSVWYMLGIQKNFE